MCFFQGADRGAALQLRFPRGYTERTWMGDIRLAAVSFDSIYPGVDEPRFRPYAEHVAVSCTKPGKVYFDPLAMRTVVSRPPFRSLPLTSLRAGGPRILRQSLVDSASRPPPTASKTAETCQFSARACACVRVEACGLCKFGDRARRNDAAQRSDRPIDSRTEHTVVRYMLC